MKKIISFLTMAVIAISASVCVFAASSPSGEPKPDKFNVVGNVNFSASVAVLDGKTEAKIDKNGNFRIDGFEAGEHTLVVKKNSDELGKVKFTISKGAETKYILLEDGSYNITVAANVNTIRIDFKIDGGKIVISKVVPAGNDSPQSPGTRDVLVPVCATVLFVSFIAMISCVYFKKKYSL